MPGRKRRVPLIWEFSEEANARNRKRYEKGLLSDYDYNLRVSDDASIFRHLLQFQVTVDTWRELSAYLTSDDWDMLEERLVPGGEWWYVADKTPFAGFGALIQIRHGKVVLRTYNLWKS